MTKPKETVQKQIYRQLVASSWKADLTKGFSWIQRQMVTRSKPRCLVDSIDQRVTCPTQAHGPS